MVNYSLSFQQTAYYFVQLIRSTVQLGTMPILRLRHSHYYNSLWGISGISKYISLSALAGLDQRYPSLPPSRHIYKQGRKRP